MGLIHRTLAEDRSLVAPSLAMLVVAEHFRSDVGSFVQRARGRVPRVSSMMVPFGADLMSSFVNTFDVRRSQVRVVERL